MKSGSHLEPYQRACWANKKLVHDNRALGLRSEVEAEAKSIFHSELSVFCTVPGPCRSHSIHYRGHDPAVASPIRSSGSQAATVAWFSSPQCNVKKACGGGAHHWYITLPSWMSKTYPKVDGKKVSIEGTHKRVGSGEEK